MKKISSINLSDTLSHIIYEAVMRYPSFHHIDANRVRVCISSNRSGRGGLYGKLVPLKFKNGSPVIRHRGRLYRMPEVAVNGVVQLYLIYFYMPRFFDLPPAEKIKVILHELYHISEDFNGDIRRLTEGKAAHGHSREHYNSLFMSEVREFNDYLSTTPYYNFLSLDTQGLFSMFRSIRATRMKMPRPYPLDDENMAG